MCKELFNRVKTQSTAREKMTQQTLNRCSNELPNDFRAKLQNPSNFDIFAFGGSLRTNCPTPCKHPNDDNKKNGNSRLHKQQKSYTSITGNTWQIAKRQRTTFNRNKQH